MALRNVDREFRDLLIASEVEECEGNFTALYWKYTAISKKRIWLTKPSLRLIYLGEDEYWRRTVVVGPVVLALWMTHEGNLLRKKLDEVIKSLADEATP